MATPYQRRLYDENKDLFMIVLRLGNKVALQNQLRVLCLNLGLYTTAKEFDYTIKELREAKLFSHRYDTYDSKSNLLIVENPVLGWAHKELKEKGININKSRLKAVNDDRIDKSLFKIQYTINFLRNRTDINTVDKLFEELEKDSSILYTEKRGLEYFNSFLKHNTELYITEYDSEKMIRELIEVSKKQKASVPSRKGKGKKYTQQKSKDILIKFPEGETPSDDITDIYLSSNEKDEESKIEPKKVKSFDEGTEEETVEYSNNFNSFLERGCLLKFEKTVFERWNRYNGRLNAVFTLYILDIGSNLNPTKIAEKTAKTYFMLRDLLIEDCIVRDNSICSKCPKNLNVCKPGNIQNGEYINCKNNNVNAERKVFINVRVATWSHDRAKEILKDCNYIKNRNELSDETQHTEFQKELKKKGIDDITMKFIGFSVRNFDLENLYLSGKSRENIKKVNEKSSTKRKIKNELKAIEIKLDENSNNTVKLDNDTINKMADLMIKKFFKKNNTFIEY